MSEELCSICLENLTNKDAKFISECQHTYHFTCIQKWTKDTCPICRTTWTIQPKNISEIPRQIEHNYDNDNVILQRINVPISEMIRQYLYNERVILCITNIIRRIRTLPENENSDRRLNILNNLTDTRTNLTDMNRRRLNIIIFNRTANNAEINRYIQQLNNIENEYQSN